MERSTNILLGTILFLITASLSFGSFRVAGAKPKMTLQRRALEPPVAVQSAPSPEAVPTPAPAPSLDPVKEPATARRDDAPEQTAPPILPDSYRAADPFQPPRESYNPAADPRHPLIDVSPVKKSVLARKIKPASPSIGVAPPTVATAAPQPPLKPEGFCLVCGAPTDNWVEIDGRKQGYCPKHMSKVKVPIERPVSTASASRRRPRVEPETPSVPSPPGDSISAEPVSEPVQSAGSRAPSAGEGELVQCRGVTKSGTQCRRKTRDPSGLCYQHRNQG